MILQKEFENYYCNKHKLPMFAVIDMRGMPGYFEEKSKWLERKLKEKIEDYNFICKDKKYLMKKLDKIEKKNIKIDSIIVDEIVKYQATKLRTQMVKEVDKCRNSIIVLEILQHRIKENK